MAYRRSIHQAGEELLIPDGNAGGTPARLAREASVQRRDFITPGGVGHPLVYFHLGKRDSDFEAVEPRGNGSLVWRLDRQQDQIWGSTVIGYPVNLLSPPGEISSSRPFLPILASRRPTQPLTLANGTLQTGFSPLGPSVGLHPGYPAGYR